MTTRTAVQNFNSTTTSIKSVAHNAAIQQLSSISPMLEYDIDNTLNALKENNHLIKDFSSYPSQRPALQKTLCSSGNIREGTFAIEPLSNMTSISSEALSPQTNARKRWRILAKVLRKDSEDIISSSDEEDFSASVRRFKSFDLLRQDSFEDHLSLNGLGKPENWFKYCVLLDGDDQLEYSVNIHHAYRHLTAIDLMGFNNTGNVCVWPSEEALTAFALADINAFRGKWILELGGGFTCLTGLMLSKYAKPYAVHLTDGNEVSVENIKKTICLNELSCYTKCSVLKWEDSSARSLAEAARFDTILSADCLFFDEVRDALVETIWFYLSEKGVALIMAPRRGKTMTLFVEGCIKRGFCVKLTQRYNETIWQRHLELKESELYDENLHYPILVRLTKN